MFSVYPEWFVITSLKRWNTRKCSPDVKVTDLSHQSHIFNVSVLLDYTGHFVMPKRTRRTVCNVIRHCYRIHANKAHLSMVTIIHHIKVTWIRECILLFARSVNGRYKCNYIFIYLHLCRLLGEHVYICNTVRAVVSTKLRFIVICIPLVLKTTWRWKLCIPTNAIT